MPDPEALRIARAATAAIFPPSHSRDAGGREEPPPHDTIPPEADRTAAESDFPGDKPWPNPDKPDAGASQENPTGAKHQAQPIRFKLIAFADVQINRTLRRYLVKKLLPNSGLTVVWGPPKCGKSFWIMDLALHVALGGSIAAARCSKPRLFTWRWRDKPECPTVWKRFAPITA
jgi:hypothetical protein